jgi:hypothetical protein
MYTNEVVLEQGDAWPLSSFPRSEDIKKPAYVGWMMPGFPKLVRVTGTPPQYRGMRMERRRLERRRLRLIAWNLAREVIYHMLYLIHYILCTHLRSLALRIILATHQSEYLSYHNSIRLYKLYLDVYSLAAYIRLLLTYALPFNALKLSTLYVIASP